jgi:hypothetical protein
LLRSLIFCVCRCAAFVDVLRSFDVLRLPLCCDRRCGAFVDVLRSSISGWAIVRRDATSFFPKAFMPGGTLLFQSA